MQCMILQKGCGGEEGERVIFGVNLNQGLGGCSSNKALSFQWGIGVVQGSNSVRVYGFGCLWMIYPNNGEMGGAMEHEM